MKESQFNIHRFLLVARRDMVENWKDNLLKCIALYALYMLCYFTYGIKTITAMPFLITLISFTVFLFASSTIFRPLKKKEERTSYLSLPASQVEKFLWRLFYVTIGFLFLNFIAVTAMEITHWITDWTKGTVQEGKHVFLFPLIAKEIAISTPPDMADFAIAIWLSSLFAIGGSLWQKHPFLKTLTALLIIYLLQLSARILPINTQALSDPAYLIIGTFFGLLCLLNWWISYRIFCRTQIVKPKLF